MGVDFNTLNTNIATWYDEGEFTSRDVKKKVKEELAHLFDEMDLNHNGLLECNADHIDDTYVATLGLVKGKKVTKHDFCYSEQNVQALVNKLGDAEMQLDGNYRAASYAQQQQAKTKKAQEAAQEQKTLDMYADGYNTADDLIGYTSKEELAQVENRLKKLNKNSIKEFLSGYNSNSSGGNGLFLQLGLETSKLKNKVVVPVMKAALDAVPAGKKTTKEYKEAYTIYKKYEAQDKDLDFKLTTKGWGWDRMFGCDDLDNFDENINFLLFGQKHP